MSKMDDMRAMREARYEAERARAPQASAAPVDGETCGHRAISGRTCTRAKGHPEKSHRYS